METQVEGKITCGKHVPLSILMVYKHPTLLWVRKMDGENSKFFMPIEYRRPCSTINWVVCASQISKARIKFKKFRFEICTVL